MHFYYGAWKDLFSSNTFFGHKPTKTRLFSTLEALRSSELLKGHIYFSVVYKKVQSTCVSSARLSQGLDEIGKRVAYLIKCNSSGEKESGFDLRKKRFSKVRLISKCMEAMRKIF